MTHQLNMPELVTRLITEFGCELTTLTHDPKTVKLSSMSLVVYIGEGQSGAPYLNDKLAADNAFCFDKISRCPLIMRLPVDWDVLAKHLDFLASDEGYELSNCYDYLTNNPFPYEVSDDASA